MSCISIVEAELGPRASRLLHYTLHVRTQLTARDLLVHRHSILLNGPVPLLYNPSSASVPYPRSLALRTFTWAIPLPVLYSVAIFSAPSVGAPSARFLRCARCLLYLLPFPVLTPCS